MVILDAVTMLQDLVLTAATFEDKLCQVYQLPTLQLLLLHHYPSNAVEQT